MGSEVPFSGAVKHHMEIHIRPDNQSLHAVGDGAMVDENVAYDAAFVDGGGSGSGQVGEVNGGEEPESREDSRGESREHQTIAPGDTAKTKTVRSPIEPSKKAREDHNATHLPYRSWCISCVSGRGVASPHVKSDEKKTIDEVGMDYCFPRGVKDGAPKVLAVRSARDGTTLSLVVPKKGLPDEWIAARLAKPLEDIGLGDVTLITKSDGEPAMKALRGAITRRAV